MPASSLAKVTLPEDAREAIDQEVEEVTEGTEVEAAQRAKTRWARPEAIVGADDRLDVVAGDIVEHWEARRSNLLGKAMVVCMSRRICVELYDRIVALRPDWHDPDPAAGAIKVITTGSAADPAQFQPHLHSKQAQRAIKARAKDVDDPLQLVIVRDMWLTGFDAPAMHTMYLDKPMQGAGLMQAIARVNRTFRDKPGGLIVDYIGIAPNLRKALAEYSPTDRDQAGVPIEQMVAVMLEKHDIVRGILHGLAWSSDPSLPADQRLGQLWNVMDHVLADPDRKARYLDQTLALTKALALCGARDEAMAIRDNVKLFADVRAAIAQLVSEAVVAEGVIDVYGAAGIDNPELSILSDEFLDRLASAERANLQLELLRRLLNDEIRS